MKPHFPISIGGSPANGGDVQTLTSKKVTGMTRVMVGPEAGPCRQPQISVQKQGDEITAIDVICSCGERISIELMH
jgi:hypothetical protein